MLAVGDIIEAQIISVDVKRNRIGLSVKALQPEKPKNNDNNHNRNNNGQRRNNDTEITTVIMADVKMIIAIMVLLIMGIVETDNFLED